MTRNPLHSRNARMRVYSIELDMIVWVFSCTPSDPMFLPMLHRMHEVYQEALEEVRIEKEKDYAYMFMHVCIFFSAYFLASAFLGN